MNMKKIMPGLLAVFILVFASGAQAGGKVNWGLSINLNHGHPAYTLHIGNTQKVHNHHYRHHHRRNYHRRHHQRRWNQTRRWNRWGHHHGRHYHVHRYHKAHRHW